MHFIALFLFISTSGIPLLLKVIMPLIQNGNLVVWELTEDPLTLTQFLVASHVCER